jgi:hypothetical protein
MSAFSPIDGSINTVYCDASGRPPSVVVGVDDAHTFKCRMIIVDE